MIFTRRLLPCLPCGIRNRTLSDHAHAPLRRQGERELNTLLIRDADRGLECIESSALNRIPRSLTVATVADEARLSLIARFLQDLDHAPLLEQFLRACVELNEIHLIDS